MSDLMQDTESGELIIVDGDLVLVDGADAVSQHLAQRLRSFRGEWFLDLSSGVPYFQDIFKKNPNPVAVDTAFKTTIIDTPGVTELTYFELTIARGTRDLNLSFSCESIDGPIDFTDFALT